MSFTGKDIASITKGHLLKDFLGKNICIDSRDVKQGDIFLALGGENTDGHNFAPNALEQGAAGAIVTNIPDGLDHNSPLVIVKNTREAIIELAKYKRENVKATYIAITGSVGKTSTKEMLKLVLAEHGKTFATPGNFNNDLGVPICMASIPEDTQYVILEAGMNQPGEISYLSGLIKPDLAIITNIEPVHLWKFKDVSAIAREKASIVDGMKAGGTVIINNLSKEFETLVDYITEKNKSKIIVGKDSDCEIIEYQTQKNVTNVKVRIFDLYLNYKLNLSSGQQIGNSIFPLIAAFYLGLDLEKSAKSLQHFMLLKGRGEISRLDNGTILIDDSYNANPASLAAALENLSEYPGRKLAIIADMLELGKDATTLHQKLYKQEIFEKIDGVIAVGEMMEHLYVKLPPHIQKGIYKNYPELANNITTITKNYDVILIKGSKGTSLYKLVDIIKS